MHRAITNKLGTTIVKIIFFEKTDFPTDGLLVSTETNLQKLSTVENNLILSFKTQW